MMPKKSTLRWTALLVLLATTATVLSTARAEEQAVDADQTATQQQEAKQEEQQQAPAPSFNAEEHTDWGHYYDPKNIFCGKYDCYRILGFDFEHFGAPEAKEITKRYRQLSRAWHPDKSKHKDAKERFVVSCRLAYVATLPPVVDRPPMSHFTFCYSFVLLSTENCSCVRSFDGSRSSKGI